MKSEPLGFTEKELCKCVDGLELYLGKGWCQEQEGAWGLVTVKGQLQRRIEHRRTGIFNSLLAGVIVICHVTMKSLIKLLASWEQDTVLSLSASLEWDKIRDIHSIEQWLHMSDIHSFLFSHLLPPCKYTLSTQWP